MLEQTDVRSGEDPDSSDNNPTVKDHQMPLDIHFKNRLSRHLLRFRKGVRVDARVVTESGAVDKSSKVITNVPGGYYLNFSHLTPG